MRRADHSIASLAVAILTCSVGLAAASPQQTQDVPPRIRVAVDVVAVDVQVIDREGKPVPNLGPEMFTVTINGRRRRVVSAEQIGADEEARPAGEGGPAAAIPRRMIMIAIDCISFDATASREVIQSVAQFVRGLQPDDHVGLSAYPNGAQISPTTDHAVVLRALDTVVGQRDGPGLAQFNLRPSEIIDISRDISSGTGPTLDRVAARECNQDPGGTCRYRLLNEVTNTALYYEGQALASLGMLQTLVTQMRGFPGRKTLLLVSGGMMASDTPGGRPDLGSQGLQVGRAAAAANTAIYTLHVDSTHHDRFAAETRRADRTSDNQRRDTILMARWLEQFTGMAGGALFTVQVGDAETALARIRTELTSYYLLGVEPADEDRDGRTHEVSVKIKGPDVTIRGRRWVMIPKRGMTASAVSAPVPVPTTTPSPALPAPADMPSRPPVPPEVAALGRIFDRNDDEAFQKALTQTRDLPHLIRGFRQSEGPWPDDRKRTAVFALELALAGLRSGTQDARDEGGRLLAEYHARVRQPAGADAFECWWFVTEAAALAGFYNPQSALLFIPRAMQRCPDSARLHLAHAFVSEQQWLRGLTTPAEEPEIVARYERAMKFPETAIEARIRAARFLHGLGQTDRAMALLDGMSLASPDLEIRYFAHLVRGQILRASGRPEEAAAAFRDALAAWPGAQSARVALMTLAMSHGQRAEAASLAEAIQSAPVDQYDPWWMYWLGDYRVYPSIFSKLRELAR